MRAPTLFTLGLICASVFLFFGPDQARSDVPLVEKAREQVGVTLSYDSSYRKLDYPGGDLPLETGVCTDVVIRAMRKLGFDLQKDISF